MIVVPPSRIAPSTPGIDPRAHPLSVLTSPVTSWTEQRLQRARTESSSPPAAASTTRRRRFGNDWKWNCALMMMIFESLYGVVNAK